MNKEYIIDSNRYCPECRGHLNFIDVVMKPTTVIAYWSCEECRQRYKQVIKVQDERIVSEKWRSA